MPDFVRLLGSHVIGLPPVYIASFSSLIQTTNLVFLLKGSVMTTAWGGILPEGKSEGDALYYLMAVSFGVFAGWMDIKVGDLLFTAMIVLATCMLLGFVQPHRPWRWILLIGLCVPLVEWAAFFFLSQKPMRAQIYESFLAFLPGIAGAYGGALGRGVVNNLFPSKGPSQRS